MQTGVALTKAHDHAFLVLPNSLALVIESIDPDDVHGWLVSFLLLLVVQSLQAFLSLKMSVERHKFFT